MKLTKRIIITVLLLVLIVFNIAGRVFDFSILSNYSSMFIFPFFSFFYFPLGSVKSRLFGFFLVSFSISGLLNIVFLGDLLWSYYLPNAFILMGYTLLLLFLIKDFNFKKLIKAYKFHLIILAVFNVYIVISLNQMIAQDQSNIVKIFDLVIESIYNVLLVLVLSFALIHYLYHQTQKSLLLFLTVLFIVFSEFVQVAYLFISSKKILQILYTVIISIGFCFLYFYIKLENTSTKEATLK